MDHHGGAVGVDLCLDPVGARPYLGHVGLPLTADLLPVRRRGIPGVIRLFLQTIGRGVRAFTRAGDVGFELVFSRQIIAHASSGDIAVAFSTSGNSADLITALREAAQRGLLTIGFAGYTGGEMAESDAVDHCFVVRSQSIHRIQESQALLGYQLWATVQRELGAAAGGTV